MVVLLSSCSAYGQEPPLNNWKNSHPLLSSLPVSPTQNFCLSSTNLHRSNLHVFNLFFFFFFCDLLNFFLTPHFNSLSCLRNSTCSTIPSTPTPSPNSQIPPLTPTPASPSNSSMKSKNPPPPPPPRPISTSSRRRCCHPRRRAPSCGDCRCRASPERVRRWKPRNATSASRTFPAVPPSHRTKPHWS